MGIKDLLGSLQSCTVQRSIKDFKGFKIAIDASSWLHKALWAVVEDIVDSGFIDSQLYVDYILMRVNELRSFGIEPLMVFDGQRSILKSETNCKREEFRRVNLEQGHRLLDSMKSSIDQACIGKIRQEAISCFQKGLAVTHDMEKSTIAALRRLHIGVIVSPYEADCQLVHLCQLGICQGIMTEDSDVLVYSVVVGKSFPILFKFDKASQSVQSIEIDKILCLEESVRSSQSSLISTQSSDGASVKDSTFMKNIGHFTGARGRRMFVQMCVLAGCDYCDSISGIGIVKAQQMVVQFKNVEDDYRIERICRHLQVTNKKVPDAYLLRAQRAEALFHYHIVYNPKSKSFNHLSLPNITEKFLSNDSYSDDRFLCDNSNSVWKAPAIDQKELNLLGPILLQEYANAVHCKIDQEITVEKLGLGMVSVRDFTTINPMFPWDSYEIHQRSQKTCINRQGSFSSYLWNYRRSLMNHVNSLRSSSSNSTCSSGQSQSHSATMHESVSVSNDRILENSRIQEQRVKTNSIQHDKSFEQYLYKPMGNVNTQSSDANGLHVSIRPSGVGDNSATTTQSVGMSANPFTRRINVSATLRPPLKVITNFQSGLQCSAAAVECKYNSINGIPFPKSAGDDRKVDVIDLTNESRMNNNPCLNEFRGKHRNLGILELRSEGLSKIDDNSNDKDVVVVKTPTSDSIVNLILEDLDTHIVTSNQDGLLYEESSTPYNKPQPDWNVNQSDHAVTHDIPSCDEASRKAFKRKYIEVSFNNSIRSKPIIKDGSSVKRLKSSSTTMKLPAITSFFSSKSSKM